MMATSFFSHVYTAGLSFSVLVWCCSTVSAQLDPNIAVLVRSPVATSSGPTTITVYREDAGRSVTFNKAVLVRGASLSQDSLNFKNRVPAGAITDLTSEPATLTLPVTMTAAERTGVYTVTVGEGEGSRELRVLITNENAVVTAEEYSTVVSQGERVTMRAVPGEGVTVGILRWGRNGAFRSSGNGRMSFPTITARNSEVFECFTSGSYSQNVHAIMNLIVRTCSEGKTGPGCMEDCPRCFNGGVCSDQTVSCLCPPGFSGDHCENVHGRNVFGQNAAYKCDDTAGDHDDGCQGAIICYPEPFGCICPAGYTGIDCMQECDDGKFGANCKQDCHCQDGVSCAKDTGECDNNQCAEGWKGINCQVEDPCEVGVYGDLCTLPCSCSSGDCSDVESNCARGCAVPWTGVACDENSGNGMITDLSYVKVNPGVSTSVTCSAIRNPVLETRDLELQGVGAAIGSSLTSGIGGKVYTRDNTWLVTVQSNPVMATCSISGTDISQSIQLVPYELPQYSSSRGLLLGFNMVTHNSIFVIWPRWETDRDEGDGPVIEYFIEYREDGGTFTESVRTTDLAHQFTGLQVDTLYEFRIVLVREGLNGDGPPSDIQTQRTLCGALTVPPTLSMESVTSRTVTFMVEIPPRDQWSCSSITASLQRQESDGQWIEVQNLSTDSGTVDVSGLIPCTNYTFRVLISNSGNSIDSGQPVEVATQPEALFVREHTVSATTTGHLRVSWSPPDISQTNCVLSLYTVMYRLVRHVACTSDVTESPYRTENTTAISTSITLSGLSDYAEYEVRVRADGEVEGTEVSVVGTTQPAAPSAAPMNINLANVSSTCLTFTWNPPPCDQRNGDIMDYRYSLYSINGTTNDTVVLESSTEATDVELCGLTPYFDYYFQVRASTSVGQGPDSEIVTQRTDEDVPPQLEPPRFPFTNTSSLQLLWQTPNPPHGIITGYNISVQSVGDSQSNMSYIVSVDAEIAGDPPSYILTDLEAVTNYSILVRANTRKGPGEWSLPTISITREGVPSPPRNIEISKRSKTEITVEWDIPEKPRGDIIRYEICYQAVERPYIPDFTIEPCRSQTVMMTTDTHIVHRITSLDPSTVYRVEVSAYTLVGQGDITSITASTEVANDFIVVQEGDITQLTREGTSATITLPPLTDTYATHYFIRVKDRQVVKRSVGGIGTYDDNPNDYITAEIQKGDEGEPFTIGDGQNYGMYRNVPLEEGKDYEIYIGTGSRVGEDTEVIWSEPLILIEKEASASLVVLAGVLVIAVIIFLSVTLVIVRRRRSAKRNKDVIIHVSADTATPKDSLSGIALKQKSKKLKVETESGYYEETEQKLSGETVECRESGYLEPSVTVSLDPKATGQQLERESHLYMKTVPVLRNREETGSRTEGDGLSSYDDGYEKADMHAHTVNVKTLSDERNKRRKLPATPQIHAVDPFHTRSNEAYEEVPDLNIFQVKVDVPYSIKIKDLPDLLQNKDMAQDGTVGDEFSKLPQGKQHPWTVGAIKDENPSSGILPYDHSRVKLEKNSSDSNFDFYNANFIKDQYNEKGFIAAQGPTSRTLENFWDMIWDQNIEVIVNLSESNENVCQYWPPGIATNKICGDLTVIWCDNLRDCCDFSIRQMKVIKGDKVHEVKLCHFLSWPETSFPLQPAAVLDFIKKVKALRKKPWPPILIHCSNGVGATGTFIAVYSLLRGLNDEEKSRTDVFEFVMKMRNNRVDMVQNESQYTFVYETLTTALLTPETAMSEDNLLEVDLNVQNSPLVKEYEVLTALSKVTTPRRSLVGQSQENANKNRFPKVIPLDSSRVVLKSPGCFVGNNDYINASLVNSSCLKDGFIMTQAPLATTVEDFWRMIYDYECAAVVLLNEMDENDEEVYFYWPEGGKVQYGHMSVKCTKVTTHKDAYIERHLAVRYRKLEKVVSVHHYQVLAWPKHKHQSGALLEIIFKVLPLVESKKRIAVHCLDGVKKSGIFVAVATEIMHLKTEKEVNLFQAIHKLRGKSPHVVTNLEDYLLCYQLLKSYVAAEESEYANIEE